MSASDWHDASAARILCAGDDLADLLQVQCGLDAQLDFVLIANADEADSALAAEAAFDIIIIDQRIARLGGPAFVAKLRHHSPDAERIIIAHQPDEAVAEMIASDSRVMRLLQSPCAAEVLCDAVADALLRHRARALRAAAVPRVTPSGGNACCMPAHQLRAS